MLSRESFVVFWNSLESFQIYWILGFFNPLELFQIFGKLFESFGKFWNFLELIASFGIFLDSLSFFALKLVIDCHTKFMKEAIKEKKSSNAWVFEKLNYVKQIYFTHRQVCEAEAVYRLSQDLHLEGSNVATTFLATGFPQHRNDYYINISNDAEDTPENSSTDSKLRDKVGLLSKQ